MKPQMRKPPGKIKAFILSLLNARDVSTIEGGSYYEGVGSLTPDAVLKIDAVWACVRLISESIATLPLSIFERTKAGKRIASEHPLHFILHEQPNEDSTASVFLEAMVAAMLLRGNAFAEKIMLGQRLVGLRFLHPDRFTVRINSQGAREVRYREANGIDIRDIPWSRIWRVPGFSLDGINGVSVIQYGSGVFGSALAAEKAARGMWERGLQQTTAWKYPNVLRPEQRDEARDSIMKLAGAAAAHNPVILEAGMEVTTIGINPNDAQLLESRAFNVESVCRWFRVPPFMVGHTEKSTSWGSGIEQQMIGFLTFTLGPWIRRIEQSISKDLLSKERSRYYPKFAVEGLLRADSAARAAFYSVMVNNGILTRDEVRELEDRLPHGGNAAVLTVQTALAPLDQIGKAEDANAAKAALQSWLKEPKE